MYSALGPGPLFLVSVTSGRWKARLIQVANSLFREVPGCGVDLTKLAQLAVASEKADAVLKHATAGNPSERWLSAAGEATSLASLAYAQEMIDRRTDDSRYLLAAAASLDPIAGIAG